jgi:hypothetical protein
MGSLAVTLPVTTPAIAAPHASKTAAKPKKKKHTRSRRTTKHPPAAARGASTSTASAASPSPSAPAAADAASPLAAGAPDPAAAPPSVTSPLAPAASAPSSSSPSASASPWRTAGWIGVGAGALTIGAGGVLAIMASNQRSDLSSRCPNDVCAEADRAEFDRGRSQANTATIAIAAGAVLVGASVALVVFGGPKKEDSQVELRAAPNGMVLGGRFQ